MNIAVIGDMILDKYLHVEEKENPEHVNPCYKKVRVEFKDGGVGNVIKNLKTLGCKVDEYYPTSSGIKTRIIHNGKYICRIDEDVIHKGNNWMSYDTSKGFWDYYDYIVVSDYLKGAINQKLARQLVNSTAKVIVDCKPNHAKWFKGAYLLKVNLEESQKIFKKMYYTEFENIVITKGEHGLVLIQVKTFPNTKGDIRYLYPILYKNGIKVKKVVDVTGAGDTVLATLAWALSNGVTIQYACELANKAGSISVQHLGCYAVKAKELK